MKAADELVTQVARRLDRTWSQELAAGEQAWPYQVTVGQATQAALDRLATSLAACGCP